MTNQETNISKCPLRPHPYGRTDAVPLCNHGACSHILLPDEEICPCHTVEEKKCDYKYCHGDSLSCAKDCSCKGSGHTPHTDSKEETWAQEIVDKAALASWDSTPEWEKSFDKYFYVKNDEWDADMGVPTPATIKRKVATQISKARESERERIKKMIEELAEIEHDQWLQWSRNIATTESISQGRLERWSKLWRPYERLTEEEKEQDRVWARKVIDLIINNITPNE